jgi:molybdenum cofactor guanylyltransferase
MTLNIAAVILCGGESRRMGRSKAWLPLGDERMLQRVVRLAGLAASPIVVVGAPGQELPALPADVIVARDKVAGRGPLQGLATGLSALTDDAELVYVTSTDAPFLEPLWVEHLAKLSGGYDLVVPYVDGRHHPLAAVYRRRSVLPVIKGLLRDDRLRPTLLVETVQTRLVSEQELRSVDPELRSLINLNFPDDYSKALREAGYDGFA